MASPAKTLVAQQQFVAELDGATVVVLEGARFPAGHAIVQTQPQWFRPAEPPAPKRARRRGAA